ncbi:MAG: LamG-like jellyroll fold domain-containing protein, partial [Acidimicrobiales bacterium]
MSLFSLRKGVVGLTLLLLASVVAPIVGDGQASAQPPQGLVAVDDVAWTPKSSAVLVDVLENDEDPDDVIDESTLSISSQPSKGTASIALDDGAVVRYTATNKAGVFSFDYTICTGGGECDSATVTVYVGNSSCTIVGTNGNDVLEGTEGDDIICAKKGDDVVIANGGDDIVFGGRGNDILFGGSGNDKLIGSRGKDELDGGDGDDELRGGKGSDLLFGSTGADLLIAGKGADVLQGGPGDDVLRARRGSDELYGGDGNDVLFGGRGADLLDGGPGNDTIRGKRGADTILGRSGDDELHGGKGPDILEGGGGSDTIFGGRGADRLDGGVGIDSLNGRAGNDSCFSGETTIKCELIQGSPGQPTNTVVTEPTSGATVTASTVGAADGLAIDVLPALSDLGALGPIVDITLDNPGTLTSALVTLPFDSSSNPVAPTMMYLDEEFGVWVPVDPIGQVVGTDTITATTSHFTYFTVLDFTSFRNTFLDVACSAAVDGDVGTYEEEVQASNPVAYWRFNDAPNPFTDELGSYNLTGRPDAVSDASLVDSSTDSATKLPVNDFTQSGAIALSGQGPGTAINPNGFTLEFWIDLGASASNAIIELSDGASPFVLAIRTGGDGPVTEVIGRFGPDGDFSTNHYFDFLSGGKYVVVTFDGTNLSTWVNAVEIDSTVTAGSLAITPSVDTLELFGYNQSEMIVDEFAIYDRAIGDDEINRHFNAATSPITAPITALIDSDSDLDGLLDCEEVYLPDGQSLRNYATNSGSVDTDGDGYTDLEEVGSRIFPGEV